MWQLKKIINIYNKKNMEKSINDNEQCVQTDVSSSYIGTLCFRNDIPFIIHNDKEYKIWNLNKISMHTFGYPQMVATIDGIYTSYKAGTKFKFSLFKNDEAYLSFRVWE